MKKHLHDLAAAHKVRGGHGGADIVVLVLHQRHGGGTQPVSYTHLMMAASKPTL